MVLWTATIEARLAFMMAVQRGRTALQSRSICFGLLHGKIYRFEALELTVDLLHGLRMSEYPSFGEHYGFQTFN